MSVPFYLGAGTPLAGLVNLGTLGLPSGFQLNDFALCVVESCNETIVVPTGYTECTPASPQGVGVAATADSSRLGIFYRVLQGTETTLNIADSGDHTGACLHVFRGVKIASPFDPAFDATWGGTAAASTVVTIPGKTTTVKDVLVVQFASNGIDIGSSQWGVFTNASLQNYILAQAIGINQGLGGGYCMGLGEMRQPGLYGSTTGSVSGSSQQTFITIPLVGVQGGAVSVDVETLADLVTIT